MGVLDRHDGQKQKGYKGVEMKENILSPRDDSQGQIIAIMSSEREKREAGKGKQEMKQ